MSQPSDVIPPWLDIAIKEIGTHELKGGENNRILEYHSVTTLHAKEDEIPWCSSFVSWCLEKCGIPSTHSALAKSYLDYGKEITEPRLGAICVFRRGETGGHVGFYVSETEDSIQVLGGNQADSVTISPFKKKNLIGLIYPDV